jgi:hypothetical protein
MRYRFRDRAIPMFCEANQRRHDEPIVTDREISEEISFHRKRGPSLRVRSTDEATLPAVEFGSLKLLNLANKKAWPGRPDEDFDKRRS